MNHRHTLNNLRLLKGAIEPRAEWLRLDRAALAAHILSRPLPYRASSVWAMPHWLTVTGLAVLAFALVGSGVGLAAQNDIPGGSLYGVKLFLEEVQITLTPSTPARVKVVLQQASRRLAEAKQATAANQQPAAKIALEHFEAKVAAATSQLAALETSGLAEEIKAAAEATTTSSQSHQKALTDISETAEAEPATLAVLIEAEKVAVATDAVAEKILLKDGSITEGLSVEEPVEVNEPAGTGVGDLAAVEPALSVATKPPAVTPQAASPEPTPAFLAARARAVERLGATTRRANKFGATLIANKDMIDPAVLAVLNKQLKIIGDTLAKAEKALASNDLGGSLDASTLTSVTVIDAEAALKLALPKPVKAPEPEVVAPVKPAVTPESAPAEESVPPNDLTAKDKPAVDIESTPPVEGAIELKVENKSAPIKPEAPLEVITPPKDAGTGTASLNSGPSEKI